MFTGTDCSGRYEDDQLIPENDSLATGWLWEGDPCPPGTVAHEEVEGMIEKFRDWYENRHDYAKSYKDRTGRKIVGFFCTYSPEEIYYAFDVLPVRILGSHEVQDVSEPHIFGMFCPFCRDVLAQGLKGRYDYLDGITIGQSCIHLRQAYTSWDIHRNPGHPYRRTLGCR